MVNGLGQINFRTLLVATTASLALMPAALHAQDGNGDSGVNTPQIIVTGQRAAQKSAIATKKNSDVIVDSVSADDVGKLPDNSVTEVLQRVVGVNITRIQTGGSSENFLGEGTGLTVRGLDKIVSQLNGRDSFSAANGRNLAWEDIPPNWPRAWT
jgi:outer membrane cobalamin receptor